MKKTTLIIAFLLLICLTLNACNQHNTDPAPSSTAPSAVMQGGLEDSIFDDIPSSETTQPSTGVPEDTTSPETQPDSSTPETQPNNSVPETKPGDSVPETKPSNPTEGSDTLMTYERFQAMTGAEQFAFQSSFANLDAFFAWYNAAKEAYDKENPSIEIGSDGVVDMEDLLGNQD